ncbi:PDR/VanB family oxidoreductase [Advenella kashmirensis]|nr:PDR/VanB family oxidoreductase [Advenella kashmirensis]
MKQAAPESKQAATWTRKNTMTADIIRTQIRQIRLESEATASFELWPVGEQYLPSFTPGAHIDIHLPGGLRRSYSLINNGGEPRHYNIAVKKELESRGGSSWFHDNARVGMTLDISLPSNDFELIENASHTILIAGGIGITPIISMISRLIELGSSWELHYCARSFAHMAFRDELRSLANCGKGAIHLYVDNLADHKRLDLSAIFGSAASTAHLYCCGPAGMLEAFIAAAKGRQPDTVHYERFAAANAAATDGGFEVKLARDGRTLSVPEGKSILDTLLDAGVDVPYACSQGICGSCVTTVLDGIPDHRDECLSDEQREANKSMMICCSGSRSKTLTLDL